MSLGLEHFWEEGDQPRADRSAVDRTFRPTFEGVLLAFDQTLSHTGWVQIERDRTWPGDVVGRGDFKDSGREGVEQDLQRTVGLFVEFRDLIKARGPDLVVHETPPKGGGRKLGNPTSSLMAAAAVRAAASQCGVRVVMVSPTAAQKRACGKRTSVKGEVREGLRTIVPPQWFDKGLGPLNENVVDAMAIAVVAMEGAP